MKKRIITLQLITQRHYIGDRRHLYVHTFGSCGLCENLLKSKYKVLCLELDGIKLCYELMAMNSGLAFNKYLVMVFYQNYNQYWRNFLHSDRVMVFYFLVWPRDDVLSYPREIIHSSWSKYPEIKFSSPDKMLSLFSW